MGSIQIRGAASSAKMQEQREKLEGEKKPAEQPEA